MQFSNQTAKTNKKVVANKSETVSEDRNSQKKAKDAVNHAQELRSIPSDVAQTFSNEVVGGVMDGFMRQILGQPMVSQEYNSVASPDATSEALLWKKKFQLAEKRRAEEKAFYLRKQQENQQKLVTIRQELQIEIASFTQDMVSWAKEVEIASFQAPASPSIYHEHFFEKLLSFVKNLRKRVKSSKIWLKMHNSKKSKKKGLWGMAQKGKSFDQEILFSGERAVSMGG